MLNYMEARELLVRNKRIVAVRTLDRLKGEEREFRTHAVINAAGPWAPEVARRFGFGKTNLDPPSLAYNVLLNRSRPDGEALASRSAP